MTDPAKDKDREFIMEIEPLINGLVNPIAAYWVHESSLFKCLASDINAIDANNTPIRPISNHAVARYLSLQLELVEAVFMPINNTIVQCIKVSRINSNSTLTPMFKFLQSTSVLDYLTRTFEVEKTQYWLGALLKAQRMLLGDSSPYYQLTTAADLQQIRGLVTPWRDIIDRIMIQYSTNYPLLVLLLLMTQVSCISGWKTARSVHELNAPSLEWVKQQSAADPHFNYRVVLQYFGLLKGALITCSEHAPLTHCFSFAASDSTLYHTTRALQSELSAEDCASILHYLRGDQSLGARMMRHELSIVRCIDKWLYEE